MLTGIDHVVVAAADPDADIEQLAAVLGQPAGGGGRHEAHGTFNRLIWLGDSYIELMGVFDPTLAAGSWWGRHALAVLDSAPAGYLGVALASDDVAGDAARLASFGSRIGQPEAGERLRPDGRKVRWRLAHFDQPDAEFGLVFLIEHAAHSAEWTPAERAARAANSQLGLHRLELPVADRRAAPLRLLRELGLGFRPALSGRGARDVAIGPHTVRLTPGVGRPRLVLGGGRGSVGWSLLGCDWLLEPTAG